MLSPHCGDSNLGEGQHESRMRVIAFALHSATRK
jgi:hypothetical protein